MTGRGRDDETQTLSEAFADVDRMIFSAALSTAVLVVLSLLVAYLAARWVSHPIQRLAATTHEIAEGSFGGSVEMKGSPSSSPTSPRTSTA